MSVGYFHQQFLFFSLWDEMNVVDENVSYSQQQSLFDEMYVVDEDVCCSHPQPPFVLFFFSHLYLIRYDPLFQLLFHCHHLFLVRHQFHRYIE
ncbi:hypothetical protein Syun_029709 [Stephania yunnanensis]|uniref:Uncharacterized protein n=1 Tax=Stephania yunnanensis TaxID=152371 RepID=A0AAP0HLL9_9MAGN